MALALGHSDAFRGSISCRWAANSLSHPVACSVSISSSPDASLGGGVAFAKLQAGVVYVYLIPALAVLCFCRRDDRP